MCELKHNYGVEDRVSLEGNKTNNQTSEQKALVSQVQGANVLGLPITILFGVSTRLSVCAFLFIYSLICLFHTVKQWKNGVILLCDRLLFFNTDCRPSDIVWAF